MLFASNCNGENGERVIWLSMPLIKLGISECTNIIKTAKNVALLYSATAYILIIIIGYVTFIN